MWGSWKRICLLVGANKEFACEVSTRNRRSCFYRCRFAGGRAQRRRVMRDQLQQDRAAFWAALRAGVPSIAVFVALIVGVLALSGCYSQVNITAPDGTTASYTSTKSVEGLEVQIVKTDSGYAIKWASNKAGADSAAISAAVAAAIHAVK